VHDAKLEACYGPVLCIAKNHLDLVQVIKHAYFL